MDDSARWAVVERLFELGNDPVGLADELRRHRELLLSDTFQAFLEDAAAELDADGEQEAVDALAELSWLLATSREAGIELVTELLEYPMAAAAWAAFTYMGA